ncbi:MAG: GNAT family N-acetyltransferase [Candidatus Thorarchaeota archaeon]
MESFETIEYLIDDYTSSQKTSIFAPPIPLADRLKHGISEGAIGVYAFVEHEEAKGFFVLGLRNGGISILHASGEDARVFRIKQEMFDFGFELLSKEFSLVRVGGGSIDEELSRYLISRGFDKFDRKHMTLSREKIEDLPDSSLDGSFTFQSYTSDDKQEMSALIYDANVDNIDVKVFPNFFGSEEAVKDLITSIENNVYGKYTEGYSLILRKEGEAVGAIFLTQTDDVTGYIPDICIRKDNRRQGLGRAILVQSFKDMINGMPALRRINLDVTMKNPARFLYESLGFEDVNHYSVHLWNKAE